MYFVILVFATFALGIGLYVLRKYPRAKEALPWFAWLFRIVQVTLVHWEYQLKYREGTDLAARFFVMAGSMAASPHELRDSRKAVGAMLDEAYLTFRPGQKLTSAEKSVLMSVYVAAISYDEIMESLASVWETHEDLEVRKATIVLIDILGEVVNLKNKLGQEYFQHLIYGLNKCLILLRDNGMDKRNLKVITSTLFRIYKLTKAYRLRRRLSGATAGEFYDKIISLIEHMAYVITVK
jgi:hypothetical protein